MAGRPGWMSTQITCVSIRWTTSGNRPPVTSTTLWWRSPGSEPKAIANGSVNVCPQNPSGKRRHRGTDGRKFPCGDGITCDLANFGGCVGDTVPVSSYLDGASLYRALHTAGNAWEWVADWYDEDYYKSTPQPNPQGPAEGIYRTVRSGSCLNVGSYLRTSYSEKLKPDVSGFFNGFRCAMSME